MDKKTHHQPARRLTLEQSDYVTAFRDRLRRGLRPFAGADLDDVVQHEVLLLLQRLEQKMASHPSPIALAAGRAQGGRAWIDYRRPRRFASFGEWLEDGRASTNATFVAATTMASFDDVTIENHMLRQALLRLPADQREVIILIDVCGYSVNEAAAMRGERRETTSRKRRDAYRSLRAMGDIEPPC